MGRDVREIRRPTASQEHVVSGLGPDRRLVPVDVDVHHPILCVRGTHVLVGDRHLAPFPRRKRDGVEIPFPDSSPVPEIDIQKLVVLASGRRPAGGHGEVEVVSHEVYRLAEGGDLTLAVVPASTKPDLVGEVRDVCGGDCAPEMLLGATPSGILWLCAEVSASAQRGVVQRGNERGHDERSGRADGRLGEVPPVGSIEIVVCIRLKNEIVGDHLSLTGDHREKATERDCGNLNRR